MTPGPGSAALDDFRRDDFEPGDRLDQRANEKKKPKTQPTTWQWNPT